MCAQRPPLPAIGNRPCCQCSGQIAFGLGKTAKTAHPLQGASCLSKGRVAPGTGSRFDWWGRSGVPAAHGWSTGSLGSRPSLLRQRVMTLAADDGGRAPCEGGRSPFLWPSVKEKPELRGRRHGSGFPYGKVVVALLLPSERRRGRCRSFPRARTGILGKVHFQACQQGAGFSTSAPGRLRPDNQ